MNMYYHYSELHGCWLLEQYQIAIGDAFYLCNESVWLVPGTEPIETFEVRR